MTLKQRKRRRQQTLERLIVAQKSAFMNPTSSWVLFGGIRRFALVNLVSTISQRGACRKVVYTIIASNAVPVADETAG